jgi:hypothetical protein
MNTHWKILVLLLSLSTMSSLVNGEQEVGEEPKSLNDATASTPAAEMSISNTPSIGYIDTPIMITVNDPSTAIQGWALDADGVEKILLRIDEKIELNVPYGLERNDVAAVHPGYPDGKNNGFALNINLNQHLVEHSQLDIFIVDKQGVETKIGSRFIVTKNRKNKWRSLFERNPQWINDPFYVLHATSAVSNGGARGLSESYSHYTSPTMHIGLRVPILYMRTTLGESKDWLFDPSFDTSKTFNDKRLVDDSLTDLMEFAVGENLSVLFTLNGGVWADAFGTAPQWDLNDHLEEDAMNCQWSQNDEVFEDDYLKGLPGSMDSPELARVLTLNTFATDVQIYKKRNLQAAGSILRQFQDEHPELFAGINLDADTYANPFFADRWHDYNPDSIRQFRQWLQGSGVYGPEGKLASYRPDATYTLDELNNLAGTEFVSWDEVDPVREKPAKNNVIVPGELEQLWLDFKSWFVDPEPPAKLSLKEIATLEVPWIRLWELFRRHLVNVHYDDLSVWLTDAGISAGDIYSSQGFSAPHHRALPFAVYLDSPVKNYDSGGMSIEGSVPSQGHLGVIIYGKSSSNNIRMETKNSLFESFYRADPDWGIVEYNTSDFRDPEVLAGYARAYRSLRDVFNYQARFVSAMAWNGSNGDFFGHPGFAAHTALRNTPMELAIKDFMVARAYLPRGALMWEFGTRRHLDYDGWRAVEGGIGGNFGSLIVKSQGGRSVLASPGLVSIEPRHNLLVLGIPHRSALEKIEVLAKDGTSLTGQLEMASLEHTAAGIEIPLDWDDAQPNQGFDIVFLHSDMSKQFQLNHAVLLPDANTSSKARYSKPLER